MKLHNTIRTSRSVLIFDAGDDVMKCGTPGYTGTSRRGTVLVTAVILAALLGISTYYFSSRTISILTLSGAMQRQAVLRVAAASAVARLTLMMREKTLLTEGVYDNPARFRMIPEGSDEMPVVLSICAPSESNDEHSRRYGLADTSAGLDVNWLASLRDTEGRLLLMHLPHMTVQAADSILDWIDSDSDPREFGAERSSYISSDSKHVPPNHPITNLSELLHVRQVTPELLLGIEPEQSFPRDVINRFAQPASSTNTHFNTTQASSNINNGPRRGGWVDNLTVFAGEPDSQVAIEHGLIPLNSGDLETTFEWISEVAGKDAAKFVIAARLHGIKERSQSSRIKVRQKTIQERLNAQQGNNEEESDTQKDSGNRMLAGLDVSRGPAYEIESFYDLINSHIDLGLSARDLAIQSPWVVSLPQVPEEVRKLAVIFSLAGDMPLRGRLNINTASEELLQSLPGISKRQLNAILAARKRHERNSAFRFSRTTEWLIEERIADLKTMRSWGAFITGHGDVFRADCFVFADSGPVLNAQVTINATEWPPRLIHSESPVWLPAAFRELLP